MRQTHWLRRPPTIRSSGFAWRRRFFRSPISDAKVLAGRQKPMTEIAILFVEIETADGHRGLGFSYS